jgi:hypothetical protein
MSHNTTMMCGIILLTVPSIQYGGYFLLQLLSGRFDNMQLNAFQKSMFRAGHAHAGVLVIFSLIAEILTDHANLSNVLAWIVRIGFPLSAILVSAGFFASASGRDVTIPNKLIRILYIGILVLLISLIILGIGLIRSN